MAYISTSTARGFAPGAFLARLGERFFTLIMRIAEADPRYKRLEALSQLSDEDLAARGMTRTDVVRHVLGDRMYL